MRAEEAATELDADEAEGASLAGAYLVHQAHGSLEVLPLVPGATLVIGRGAEADIRVDSPKASRRHAQVTLSSGHVLVEDLGSRNGTRVGAEILRSAVRAARSGETVQVGPLELLVARADRALTYQSAAPAPDDRNDDGISAGDAVIVADAAMTKLFKVIRRVAVANAVVLVRGETGAGKEIVAARLHAESARADGPYVRVSCASIPGPLLESELFGHERGAFTGADRRRIGWFEAASGGTLLLDEIGELPLELQAKLLRVLEERAISRVGGTQTIPVDVRVICATHRDLEAMVAAGTFRQDLYFRLTTFILEVPPLRERRGEILLLADMFARRFARSAGVAPPRLTPDAVALLHAHPWPGNVRELRNAIEHGVVMADGGAIEAAHLPRSVGGGALAAAGAPPSSSGLRDRMEEVERAALVAALAAENGNRTRAASRLSMSRRAVIYKMIKYGLR
ncbi:MAG: hypothetical protein JWP97_5353 [Labilithrix sp.]|nr:hypothetical protein [Labilithrix sp.]